MASASTSKPTAMLVFDIYTLVNLRKNTIGNDGVRFIRNLMEKINIIPSVVSRHTLPQEGTETIISNFFRNIHSNSIKKWNVPLAYNPTPAELYTKNTLVDLYKNVIGISNSSIHEVPYPVYFFSRDKDSVERMISNVTGAFQIKENSDWNTALESIQRTISVPPSEPSLASFGGGAASSASLGPAAAPAPPPAPLNLSGSLTNYGSPVIPNAYLDATPVLIGQSPTVASRGGKRKTKRNLRKRRQTKGKRRPKK
jgi:hypothetical protein